MTQGRSRNMGASWKHVGLTRGLVHTRQEDVGVAGDTHWNVLIEKCGYGKGYGGCGSEDVNVDVGYWNVLSRSSGPGLPLKGQTLGAERKQTVGIRGPKLLSLLAPYRGSIT